jgi:hypothetical protein
MVGEGTVVRSDRLEVHPMIRMFLSDQQFLNQAVVQCRYLTLPTGLAQASLKPEHPSRRTRMAVSCF